MLSLLDHLAAVFAHCASGRVPALIRQGLATPAGHEGDGGTDEKWMEPGVDVARPEDHFIDGGDGRLLIAWAALAGQ